MAKSIRSDEAVAKDINEILNVYVNPQLGMHNGSCELTGLEKGVAKIKFLGACAECVASSDTFEDVIKATILEKVPEVKDVVVDDTVSQDILDLARKILNHEV